MQKAENMGTFYRVPADNRNLNYNQYFSEGETKLSKVEDYHSHNTEQLDIEGMKALLSKLPLIKKEVFGDHTAVQYPG
jgi:UDP-glucose 4-epimerase